VGHYDAVKVGPPLHPDVRAWAGRGGFVDCVGRQVFVIDVAAERDEREPVLLLHGFPSSSFDWRHVIDRLAQRRRVVAFDFVGFGLSEKPDVRYSIRLHADTAEAVVAHCGLRRVTLVTHDMGDTVGGELLARDLDGTRPFDIAQRVITNGSIYLDMAHLTAGQQLLSQLPDAATDLVDAHGFRAGLAETFAPATPASDNELDAQWQLMAHRDGNTLLPRLIRYLEDRRAEEARFTGGIERHPSRLGVIWADLDPVAVYGMALRLIEARPDARLVTLAGIGHYPMVEAPAQFSDALVALLDRDDPDPTQ
jgi:pimeloyl-ACP methyl ester carboxylesterase